MQVKTLISIAILFVCSYTAHAQIANVIPQPHLIQKTKGKFQPNKETAIHYNDVRFKAEADLLASILNLPASNVSFANEGSSPNTISLQCNRTLGAEAYQITVDKKQINCHAATPQGMFFAIQTLKQAYTGTYWEAANIQDAPQYPWRGFMLDVSRHFFGVDVVKDLLDVMAHLKMNVFHMHLTDENGWRIEIKKYPKLTEIGAEGSWSDLNAPRKFYTQEEIKEIVAYAAERHIMVVPEIDMPGHATAASKAYPEISGGGEGRWKGFTFHPIKDSTYLFIEEVFDEVFSLFPAPYIHIGGDEVHFGNQSWKTDFAIQQFIKDHHLKDEVGLEHYFVRRVCDIINKKGRKMIGWDEIISSGVTPEQAIVMWWRHDRPNDLPLALQKGFEVILTPRIPCYLDFVQDETQKIGRRWGTAYAPLQAGYEFPSDIIHLVEGHEKQVRGMQANLWTERIADVKRLNYMTFPRLAGISEAAWSGESEKNYEQFLERLKVFLKYLDSKGINYFNPFDKESTPEPWGPTKQDVIAKG